MGEEGARGSFRITLPELLVLIALLAVLAAVILPGIHRTRGGGGRRADCLNNLMNLGKAFHNYHANQGCLPPSGRWDVRDPATRTEWSDLSKLTAANAATMRYSWALELAPYLDHSDITDQWDFSDQLKEPVKPATIGGGSYWLSNTPKLPNGGNAMLAGTTIRVLTCSADPTTQPGKGNLSYVVNGGFHYDWRMTYEPDGRGGRMAGETPREHRHAVNLRRMGAFFLQSGTAPDKWALTFAHFADGATSTVIVTENINAGVGAAWEAESPGFTSNWACPHPWNTSFFVNGFANGCDVTLGNDGGYRFDRANVRGREAPPGAPNGGQGGINGSIGGEDEGVFPYPNSLHPGVVNMLMADGHARPISESVDGKIWAKLVTPAGSALVRPSDGMRGGGAQTDPKTGIGFTEATLQEAY